MARYAIYFEVEGNYYDTEIVEAENEEDARKIAYEAWREAAESNADYGAKAIDDDVTAAEYTRGHGFHFYKDED